MLTRSTPSSTYGQSLSYASADAQNGASSPQILAKDLTIPSNKEVVIFSDRKCENGDCGFVRPGTVAYRASFFVLSSFSPPRERNRSRGFPERDN